MDQYVQYKLDQILQEHRLVSLITLLRGLIYLLINFTIMVLSMHMPFSMVIYLTHISNSYWLAHFFANQLNALQCKSSVLGQVTN